MRAGVMLALLLVFAGPVPAGQTAVSSVPVDPPPDARPQTTGQRAGPLEPTAIRAIMANVADWQLAHPSKHPTTDWTHGALFSGLAVWAAMADTDRYFEALRAFGEKSQWKLGPRRYHADDHCVGHAYLTLYERARDPNMIRAVIDGFDWLLAHPSDVTLEAGKQQEKDRWWWCDALFMGPPVWTKLAAVTGQRKYLDFMNAEWWATTDYLYDKDEHLYFRDSSYFGRREANGRKVFWSRGNGWVFAGLARVLQDMPTDYRDQPRYVRLYRDMAAKLITLQQSDGLWRSSLLDPDAYTTKETSGTGFYCFGLAWGVNRGLLDEATYRPAIEKAWQGLVGCVHPDGMLGYVQPIGAAPDKVREDLTEIYGVGAFLLAGSEVHKMAIRSKAKGE